MPEDFTVVGAGTMGAGIAYVAASSGFEVTLVEVDPAGGSAALRRIGDWADKALQKGRFTVDQAAAARQNVTVVATLPESPAQPEVLVEAVPERLGLKRRVLADAQQLDPKLLASNTSSISIDALAQGLQQPERFVGLHFFNPVYAMALLEIVVGEATGETERDTALALASRLGKQPIVVRDSPGFATSRLGNALGLEAMRMYASGVASAADIDKAMVLGYRHPMGPLELSDVIGLDVRLDIARTLQDSYGERFAPPALLEEFVAQGKLGKKAGEGFYQWVDGQKIEQ